MPNKDLEGRFFKVPTGLKGYLQAIANDLVKGDGKAGDKRLTDILSKGKLSYEQMNRIKSYFTNYKGDGEDKEYKLNGGKRMETWINSALDIASKAIENVKDVKQEGGMLNTHRKDHERDSTKNPTKPTQAGLPEVHKVTYNALNRAKVLMEYLNKR